MPVQATALSCGRRFLKVDFQEETPEKAAMNLRSRIRTVFALLIGLIWGSHAVSVPAVSVVPSLRDRLIAVRSRMSTPEAASVMEPVMPHDGAMLVAQWGNSWQNWNNWNNWANWNNWNNWLNFNNWGNY